MIQLCDFPVIRPFTAVYTNWRGETALRCLIPQKLWFGSTEYHPEPQWLLTCEDVDKGVVRDFALTGFEPVRAS